MSAEGGSGARIHVVRFAPAKLNLTLAVVGRRADGYHDLHSVMVPLSLGDALTVSPAPLGSLRDSLRITGLPMPSAADNLVLRAIAATRAELAVTRPDVPASTPSLAARLAKRVPVAAGLGGGSSDAAAAIDAALAAWGSELDADAIAALATGLGSDVPFFLAHGAALVTGRGEFVEPLPEIAGEPPAVLLVTPQLPLATPAVFEAYAGGARQADAGLARDTSGRLAAEMKGGLTAPRLLAIAEELAAANDLLAAAASIVPGFHAFIDALERLVGRPVCQSGSGPTLWSLFPSLAEARKAARFVRLAAVNGTLPRLGTGEPFIAATTIAGRATPPRPRSSDDTTDTTRPRTVHNVFDADRRQRGRSTTVPGETKGEDPR